MYVRLLALSTSASEPIVLLDDDDLDVMPHLEPMQPIVPQANMGSIKAFHALQKVKSYHHDDDKPPTTTAASSGSRPSLGSTFKRVSRGELTFLLMA